MIIRMTFNVESDLGKWKGSNHIIIFRPSDYFSSDIIHRGKVVGNIHGTYLGYIDCDDHRYW